MNMKYKFKASQTIYKIVEIEASSEDEAQEKIEQLLGEGEVRFDDEPWLDMEVNFSRIES